MMIRIVKMLLTTFITLFMVGGFAQPAHTKVSTNQNTFNDSQKAEVERIVHDYLVKNPEVLLEVSRELQRRQQQELQKRAQQSIKDNIPQLFQSKVSPVLGNAQGNVNVVEFFDYQCIHCKEMSSVMKKILQDDPNVRIIHKQLPIFGDMSTLAAKAALAAQKQNKYKEFHEALMQVEEKLSEDKIMNVAKQVGLNTKQLSKDMNDPALDEEIKSNYRMANDMSIMGTPAFIIAENPARQEMKAIFAPGAMPVEKVAVLIQQVRGTANQPPISQMLKVNHNNK
jgi:protein-disulfide isomerase